ncbi:hypothetical protein NEP59_26660, partial [Escherichia coli]|nr:hypothetical protein [Escherichia coli]
MHMDGYRLFTGTMKNRLFTGCFCYKNITLARPGTFRNHLVTVSLAQFLFYSFTLQAANIPADIPPGGNDAFIIQQQRQEALEQQLTPSAPDVRLSAPGSF